MLRPSNSLLGSSRAARRANLRAERVKTLGHVARALRLASSGLLGGVFELVLLWGLPVLYLAASYLVLDLPARWLSHREPATGLSTLLFLGSCGVCLIGIARALQDAPPLAPVRPQFAKAMLAVSWVAALLLTAGDLAS